MMQGWLDPGVPGEGGVLPVRRCDAIILWGMWVGCAGRGWSGGPDQGAWLLWERVGKGSGER